MYLTDDHLPDDAEFQMFRPSAVSTRCAWSATAPTFASSAPRADARNIGYAVEVVRERVPSFDGEAHRSALKELIKTLGAKLIEVRSGVLKATT